MFRLFLIKLLSSSQEAHPLANSPALPEKEPEKQPDKGPTPRLRNRRSYERFDLDHKHLALMNDQEIFLIRDLSSQGFSCEVSERALTKLHRGDVYLCRLRYLGEVYEANACVRWAEQRFVGFELVKPGAKLAAFMKRLLKPLEIAHSFAEVDARFVEGYDNEGLRWFQGAESSNLYLWYGQAGEVKAWRLATGSLYACWDGTRGIRTGSIEEEAKPNTAFSPPWQQSFHEDEQLNPSVIQFVTDIFMALQLSDKDKLLSTLVT